MAVVQGVDLSAMQGNIPLAVWQRMKDEQQIAYASLRCHVGNNTQRDAVFARYAADALSVGILRKPYFFPFPLPHLDPVAQAEMFLKSADVGGHPLGADEGELPPDFDLEWPPPEEWQKRGCTADSIVDWALACLAKLEEEYGVLPVVYSYPYFIQALSKAKNFAQLMRYPLWIAGGAGYLSRVAPPSDLSVEKVPVVSGWGANWLFWQWNGNNGARLPNGVDADFDAFRFDLDKLHALARMRGIDDQPPDTLPDLALIAHIEASDLIVEDGVHAFRQERAQRMLDAA